MLSEAVCAEYRGQLSKVAQRCDDIARLDTIFAPSMTHVQRTHACEIIAEIHFHRIDTDRLLIYLSRRVTQNTERDLTGMKREAKPLLRQMLAVDTRMDQLISEVNIEEVNPFFDHVFALARDDDGRVIV